MSIFTNPSPSRRTVLGVGGASVAGLALASCAKDVPGGGSQNTDPDGSSGSEALLPSHVRNEAVKADLVSDHPSAVDGFLEYPEPIQTVAEPPGDGSTVTVSTLTFSPPPTSVGVNQRWQAINTALGAEIDFQLVPQSEYARKFTTMMTSSDLPDLMLVTGGPRVRQFVAASCADLSEFIGGDAVKEYPNLANLPTSAWQSMGLVGGRVMGIPIPRMIQPYVNHVNRDVLDKIGADDTTWGADEFLKAMKDATSGSVHGFGASGFLGVPFFAAAMGAPNQWGVEDGQFVSTFATDTYRAAVEMARQAYTDKLYHPDTASVSLTDLWNIFIAGNMAACYGSFGTFANGKRAQQVNGRFHNDVGLPFGGKSGWAQPGMFGWVAFKKADPDRIRMLLRICDFLAAPFGSSEFELLKYGVEGTHFTRSADGPELTQLGQDEPAASLPFDFIANAPEVIRIPGEPEAVQRAFDVQAEMAPEAIADPSEGLFSETFDKSGSSITQKISDAIVATVAGRASLDDFDNAVQEYLDGGGKAVADEYSAAAAD